MTDEPTQTEESNQDENIWKRLAFMVLFAVLYGVSDIVLFTVALVQFGFVAITGEKNEFLLDFSTGLTKFIYQIVRFMTFKTETMPFPFSPWPGEDD